MCGAPGAQDSKGNTLLHFAAGYARGALARRLVEAGANGAVENGDGNTPLELVTCGTRPDHAVPWGICNSLLMSFLYCTCLSSAWQLVQARAYAVSLHMHCVPAAVLCLLHPSACAGRGSCLAANLCSLCGCRTSCNVTVTALGWPACCHVPYSFVLIHKPMAMCAGWRSATR